MVELMSLWLVLFSGLVGCGKDVCGIGEVQECTCAEGGKGIQKCVAGGEKWGPCEECQGGDTSNDPTDCAGNICAQDECCDGFACSSWYYENPRNEELFLETYCYPMCDLESEDVLCASDEVCSLGECRSGCEDDQTQCGAS